MLSLILIPVFYLASFAASLTCRSTGSASSNALSAFTRLQQHYNQGTGLWDTTGWWNSANCLTTICNLAQVQGSVKGEVESTIAVTFIKAQAHNGGNFLDGFLDDEGWWALALIDSYDLTGNSTYLTAAESIFDDMKKQWPSPCYDGGIWWDKAHTYVNAIANELFFSVAAHLANRVPNQKSTYKSWADKSWTWFQKTGMINSQHTINDGLVTSTCKNNGETVWSYNQGVILGALVAMHKLYGDQQGQTYLNSANQIATAAISALTNSDGVLIESCDPHCGGGDVTQFKGVFARNLGDLAAATGNSAYKNFFAKNAASIWAKDRQGSDLSEAWAGPFVSPANASTQSSALDALVEAARFS